MRSPSPLIGYEESLARPENKLEEVVEGKVRILPPPKKGHAFLIDRLTEMLKEQLDRREFRVMTSTFGQVISRQPFTYRIPDLAVYRRSEMQSDDYYIFSAPLLVVECLSPANVREELTRDYARIATAEMWLFAAEEQVFSQFASAEAALNLVATQKSGTAVSLSLKRADGEGNVGIDLDELWREYRLSS
jgi:Uma2 family endonuclease